MASDAEKRRPRIRVLAGVNGAGKSSVVGAALRARGQPFYNPDEVAERIHRGRTELADEANSIAWNQGRAFLERAIEKRIDFTFESTLGGKTIVNLLRKAIAQGFDVDIIFVGLDSPELHIERMKARVAAGGHAIDEQLIRERFDRSRQNLIDLLPGLAELKVYDNSMPARPRPHPVLILHMRNGWIEAECESSIPPDWAKWIIVAARASSERRAGGP
ncbi:MAG TPA: zeta toxin family protein [Kofleriaceae bacterium]|jgi:predicted ABC-type ATPase